MEEKQRIQQDTIAAIATAMTPSGIGIVRISGENALAVADRVCRTASGKMLAEAESHTLHYGHVFDGENVIDEVMIAIMRAPRSYTREDVVEIDCHGGITVMHRVLETVLQHGARLAEPGEFTKRAFLNGRMDLSEAEAVIDLINAKTDMARETSLKQLRGSIRHKTEELRAAILYETAYMEAAMDDPEHYDLEGYGAELEAKTEALLEEAQRILDNSKNGSFLTQGIKTTIIGTPNVGKSSLLNLLAGKEKAIVTEIAGTTRDTIEETIVLKDLTLIVTDTAGLRKTEDRVEKIGVERSLESMREADLVLFVIDGTRALLAEEAEILDRLRDPVEQKPFLVLCNKADLPLKELEVDLKKQFGGHLLFISAKTGQGVEQLSDRIREMFFAGRISMNEEICITNARQREAMQEAVKSLTLVKEGIANGMPEDLLSVDMMDAYRALGKILGETVEEDLIDEIFDKFCMGK